MQLPGRLFELFGEHAIWSDDHEGVSGETLRVTSPTGAFYVKQGPAALAEHDRLLWLKRWANVPDIVAFEEDALVLADAGWRSLERRPLDAGTVMGATLRALHDLPVRECPFDERLDVKLARAAERVRDGLVDAADFDADHAGLTPDQVYERLVAGRPASEDLVVTHGDYTPANVLAPPTGAGEPVLVDVGALGVADRHVDLAVALRELEGPAAGDFLAAYGPAEVDQRKLDYYRLLDELF
ncbi:aminoglycoside 3'-phosphotransferase [Nonomuraea sp. LPB2021202275-12-8]|uniref:aminoglycoside 3'-phosphotransferase n=1 Tax=Nonomuraea sp. LPB2021202275-12-8 TaxID=3120159 RepID=UPI00300C7F2D